jgi:hypothetical protein
MIAYWLSNGCVFSKCQMRHRNRGSRRGRACPAGQIEKRRFKSVPLKNEGQISVYLPPEHSREAKPRPLLLLFDEFAQVPVTRSR